MPYAPPSGWVETRPQTDHDAPAYVRFHVRADCPRITNPCSLRWVDKPYSATRCSLCASEVNEPALPSSPVGTGEAVGD
jgi:hypothetical protein